MLIERTNDEVIIRLPNYVDTENLQKFINLLVYKEAVAKSQATQADAPGRTRPHQAAARRCSRRFGAPRRPFAG